MNELPDCNELPDYEVEIEITGARIPVFGYAQVRGKSTQEALDRIVRMLDKQVGISWWDRNNNPLHWQSFFQPGMDVQIAAITPYGTKWSLRRYADAMSSSRSPKK